MGVLSVLTNFIAPWTLLVLSAGFFVRTLLHYVFTLTLPPSIMSFRHAWFSRVYAVIGPSTNAASDPIVGPLLNLAYGRVLDLGPGPGYTMKHLDPKRITSSLAIEPAVDLIPELKENARKAGLLQSLKVVERGAEEMMLWGKGPDGGFARLNGDGLKPEEFDTVIVCRVLCGVPKPEEIVKGIYKCLKPGGQVLVYEHVVNGRSCGVRLYQSILQIVWPYMMGGCQLTRDTAKLLREAGDWETVDLGAPKGEAWYEPIPYTMGRLVKAKN